MLALTRKKGESLVVNNNIEITVLDDGITEKIVEAVKEFKSR